MPETRTQRRRRQNRAALLAVTEQIMEEKGCDATTVQEIADRADVALGTFYSYFDSKDDIIIAVMEAIMTRMGHRIRIVTDNFDDPGQAFAFGTFVVMETAASDPKWRWLLNRPDTLADAIVRALGPYAKADIRRSVKAKRYDVDDIDLVYRQAVWAIVATCLSVAANGRKGLGARNLLEQATANILCMFGVNRKAAREIAHRARPKLPPDE
jgi:AcrR family transcriptional regulator